MRKRIQIWNIDFNFVKNADRIPTWMSSLNMRYSFLYLMSSLMACFDWKSSNWTRAVGQRSLMAAINSSGMDKWLLANIKRAGAGAIYLSDCNNHHPPVLLLSFPGICWLNKYQMISRHLCYFSPGVLSESLIVGSNIEHDRKNTSVTGEYLLTALSSYDYNIRQAKSFLQLRVCGAGDQHQDWARFSNWEPPLTLDGNRRQPHRDRAFLNKGLDNGLDWWLCIWHCQELSNRGLYLFQKLNIL